MEGSSTTYRPGSATARQTETHKLVRGVPQTAAHLQCCRGMWRHMSEFVSAWAPISLFNRLDGFALSGLQPPPTRPTASLGAHSHVPCLYKHPSNYSYFLNKAKVLRWYTIGRPRDK